jgi:hypothetical protein
MKIYLAGNITVPREKTLMGYQADRLYTFIILASVENSKMNSNID